METTEAPSFLLLLPPSPSPPTQSVLNAAYGDTLVQVLKEVANASQESQNAAVLDIALACPHLVGSRNKPRSNYYAETQSIVAGVYKLICVIAAKERINIEDADGVDVRVLLVAWRPDERENSLRSSYGPIIDLECLASSQRAWQYAFGVENSQGEAFVKAFVAAKSGSHGLSQPQTRTSNLPSTHGSVHTESTGKNYKVAVGGTFDHIHVGHKLLLTMTLFAADEHDSDKESQVVVVGITGDELLQNKKYADQLETWHDRQQSALRFLSALTDFSFPGEPKPTRREVNDEGSNGHAVNIVYPSGLTLRFVEISDPFGPTITEKSISALIISGETRSGCKAVNDKRSEKGWPALQVLEIDVLDPEESTEDSPEQAKKVDEAFQGKLSSTEIRRKLHAKATASL